MAAGRAGQRTPCRTTRQLGWHGRRFATRQTWISPSPSYLPRRSESCSRDAGESRGSWNHGR
eukprot:11188939-Lingulodinium_polyedra.AAC.1